MTCAITSSAVVFGLITGLPAERAAAEYQHLPAVSPKTWTYAGTLGTLHQRSSAASDASSAASAVAATEKKAYAAAQKALANAQSAERAAAAAQRKAKISYERASTPGAKAKARYAYNKSIGVRHDAIDAVRQASTAASRKALSSKKAASLAATAASSLAVAKTRVSKYQYMYGSSPTSAFTKLESAYSFSGNRRRPDAAHWAIYNTPKTKTATARDRRYVGIYNNNLEVTSWGTIGSGTCLCREGSLPTTPYGRWEVRAKVNRNTDHGVAILLWPNDRQGPESGEIDLAEFNQNRTQANFALHYDEENLQMQTHILGDFRQWHTYRVDWNSRGIAWYIDNNLFSTVVDKAAIPTKPFHLVIQAGANSSKSSKTSTTVTVSSVKVYRP